MSIRYYFKKVSEIIWRTYFYKITISLIFTICGYEEFSIIRIIKLLFPFTHIEDVFTDCYMVFYLVIPFINRLIRNLNESMYIKLVVLLLTIYTGCSIIGFNIRMNYFSWFIVVYIIAAYIRIYPKQIF